MAKGVFDTEALRGELHVTEVLIWISARTAEIVRCPAISQRPRHMRQGVALGHWMH